MSTNVSNPDKDSVELPTPDRDVPGVTDLSTIEPGDTVHLQSRQTPLTVDARHKRTQRFATGVETTQWKLTISHDRENATPIEVVECLNRADGSVIELIDADDGTPVRLFAEAADE